MIQSQLHFCLINGYSILAVGTSEGILYLLKISNSGLNKKERDAGNMSHNQSNYSATIMATYQYANQNNEEDNYEET